MNNTLFFNILDHADLSLGKVTVHCHATTRVVQLQGSRLIMGLKAPIWFFNNVLRNIFETESNSKEAHYIGETNASIHTRGLQHLRDVMKGPEGSHMMNHLNEYHPGQNPKETYQIRVYKSHKSAFVRALSEVIQMKY